MTVGQLYESLVGNWCAKTGTHSNATIFKTVDIESIAEELESIGMNRYGYHRLYSGITGEYIDSLIFMGPTYYQRLQKFVIDTVYSISQGASDSQTRRTKLPQWCVRTLLVFVQKTTPTNCGNISRHRSLLHALHMETSCKRFSPKEC